MPKTKELDDNYDSCDVSPQILAQQQWQQKKSDHRLGQTRSRPLFL